MRKVWFWFWLTLRKTLWYFGRLYLRDQDRKSICQEMRLSPTVETKNLSDLITLKQGQMVHDDTSTVPHENSRSSVSFTGV